MRISMLKKPFIMKLALAPSSSLAKSTSQKILFSNIGFPFDEPHTLNAWGSPQGKR